MANAVIVDAVRTAGGKRNGKLSGWHPADLAGRGAQGARRAQRPRSRARRRRDHGLRHAGRQPGPEHRPQRRAGAGWPESVPATTVDRQCGSSQQSAHFAAQGVIAGAYDIVVAAGVEVMTTTPMGASITPGSLPVRPVGAGPLQPRAASSPRASRPS